MEDAPKHRPSVRQLSKTPSWVMLGFLLGAAFIWALPRHEEPVRPIIVATPQAQRAAPPAEPRELTTIEAVFDRWSEYAVWDNDVTQVAMWNSAVGDFAENYEVLRTGGTYYFRSIPHLTNRPIRHGKSAPPECPLQFTETEDQYREWRDHDRYERPAESTRPSVSLPPAGPTVPRPTIEVRPTPRLTPPPSYPEPQPAPTK